MISDNIYYKTLDEWLAIVRVTYRSKVKKIIPIIQTVILNTEEVVFTNIDHSLFNQNISCIKFYFCVHGQNALLFYTSY